MRVTIIGSNGFLSKHIGLYCNQNCYELNLFGRSAPSFYKYTFFNQIDLLKEKINFNNLLNSDIIFYTAGAGIQSHLKEKYDSIFYLNVITPVELCNRLKDLNYKGKLITFGSYFEIGENLENWLFSEIDILQTQLNVPNDYALSKRVFSRFISSFNATFDFLHFILPTIYGEGESTNRLIPHTLKSIKENQALNFTSGEQIRQYIYIEDVVNILFESIKLNICSGIYNIEGVEEFSVKELVFHLFELCDKNIPDNMFGKVERDDIGMKILKLNGMKLKEKIRYRPKVKISEVYKRYLT